MSGEIQISIIVITYNHESFISRCLDSIVSQKCSVSFEVIVGDDASTDNTANIIREFSAKYPSIILTTCNKANVGMNYNLANMILQARGEFIAFCEGDDFWHNPNKLQYHYEFLKPNQKHSMVYSDYGRFQRINEIEYWVSNTISSHIPAGFKPTTLDLLKDVHIHISAILARTNIVKEYLNSEYFQPDLKIGDIPLFLFLSIKGHIQYLKFSASTYTLNPNSVTNKSSLSKFMVVSDRAKVCEWHWCQLTNNDRKEIRAMNKNRLFEIALIANMPYQVIKNMDWLHIRKVLKLIVLIFIPSLLHKKWELSRRVHQELFITNSEKLIS